MPAKILWMEGIHRISVFKADALNCVGPLFTLLFAYALQNTRPTLLQLISLIPLIVGILLITRQSKTARA